MLKKQIEELLTKISEYEEMFPGERAIVVGNIDDVPDRLQEMLEISRKLCGVILNFKRILDRLNSVVIL